MNENENKDAAGQELETMPGASLPGIRIIFWLLLLYAVGLAIMVLEDILSRIYV